MSQTQRNVSLAIVFLFFGGYVIFEGMRSHWRSAYEACFLGVLLTGAILLVARSLKRPPA